MSVTPSHSLIYWFTQDLRIAGNPALQWIQRHRHNRPLLAVFVWPKGRSISAQAWLAEALLDLRKSLAEAAIEFVVLRDGSLSAWDRLLQAWPAQELVAMSPHNDRDRGEVLRVAEAHFGNHLTLLADDNLLPTETLEPCKLLAHSASKASPGANRLPSFTMFRRMTEAAWSEVVNSLKSELPDLRDARFDANLRTSVTSPKADQGLMSESELQAIAAHGPRAFGLRGGETAACARLRYYFWELDQRDANHALSPQGLRVYQETRNGMLERDDSSKFSPYLSWGCLSPRQIARELINFEQDRVANDSTQWFWQELLWREYFRWLAKVSGPQLFELDGVRPLGSAQNLNQNLAQNPVWSEDRVAFARWREGRTGVDFVDANMRELAQTGWMSNRGRQNVASYLAKTLRINWTWGAQYFEDALIDSDRPNNWGNWMYLAGVGTDPRDRVFNIERQAEMYDTTGAYRQRWLKP